MTNLKSLEISAKVHLAGVENVISMIDNIEKERVRLNLTQAQMAQKLDMSVSNYKKLFCAGC